MLGLMLFTWAMKIAAIASYRAVPSMLIVAPMGRINLDYVVKKKELKYFSKDLQTLGLTLFLFSRSLMVTGSVALLEPVPKAVV